MELSLAVSKGYQVLVCFEAHIWPAAKRKKFCPETQRPGVFSAFMQTFIKMKAQASGWPANVTSMEDKVEFQREFFRRQGVWLDIDKVKKNPALRTVGKLKLNSLWGRQVCNKHSLLYTIATVFIIQQLGDASDPAA